MTDQPIRRGRGRPKGSRNKPKSHDGIVDVSEGSRCEPPRPSPSASDVSSSVDTTAAALETQLREIDADLTKARAVPPQGGFTARDVAGLLAQRNATLRSLLKIRGDAAPTNTDLLRAPQVLAFVRDVLGVCCNDCLEKVRAELSKPR